jgi:hypothetical protein
MHSHTHKEREKEREATTHYNASYKKYMSQLYAEYYSIDIKEQCHNVRQKST